MTQITITEGLAEIKTILARVEKKRNRILQIAARDERLADPLVADGGSKKVVAEELQAIGDLNKRIVTIRNAITEANLSTTITIDGVTQSVHDWLVWRREVSDGETKFLNALATGIDRARSQVQTVVAQSGGSSTRRVQSPYMQEASAVAPVPIVVNVDENELSIKIEAMANTLGTLDGQLSLKNATTLIEV